VFTRISSALFALLGLPAQRDERVTHHDILAMTQAGTDAGVLAQQEQQVIENVFELDTRTVESAMTSRERVVFLLVDDSEESIRQQIAADPHSTYVVCQESIDHVVGYVDSADLFQRVLTGESILLRGPSAEGLLQRVLVVPDRLTLSEMLKQFRQAHEDFAVIVNEYSLVVGVITLNDVMSTVMGDLVAPHEVEQQIIRRDDGTWLVDGVTPVVDVQRMLGIEDWPHAGQYDTVAGFLMVMLRRIPRRTDHVQLGPWRFEVVDVDSYRIDQVLVSQKPAASVDPSAGGGLPPSLPPPN
jgi:CBS domain containing-hemolysin-like protein